MRILRCSLTHWQVASDCIRALSSPRGWRWSTFSKAALCLSRARRSRLVRRRFSRSVISRSTSQTEAFLEGQLLDIRHTHLLGQGGGHSGTFQCLEFIQGGMLST